MDNSTKLPTDMPPPGPTSDSSSIRNNKDKGCNHINQHKPMPPPPLNPYLQVNNAVSGYYYCTYERQQDISSYNPPQYQRYHGPPQFRPPISTYGQYDNNLFYNPSPFGHLGFRQNLQENVGQGDKHKQLAIAKSSVQPPGGAIKAGQFFFSNKIYIQLSLKQQVRLGAVNPGTQNKCRKIRPWLVLSELDSGNVVVL